MHFSHVATIYYVFGLFLAFLAHFWQKNHPHTHRNILIQINYHKKNCKSRSGHVGALMYDRHNL